MIGKVNNGILLGVLLTLTTSKTSTALMLMPGVFVTPKRATFKDNQIFVMIQALFQH